MSAVTDLRDRVNELRRLLAEIGDDLEFFASVPPACRHIKNPDARARAIARRIVEDTPYSLAQLSGQSRNAAICAVRFAYYRAAHEAGLSSNVIGSAVNRHHTTVLYALRKMQLAERQAA